MARKNDESALLVPDSEDEEEGLEPDSEDEEDVEGDADETTKTRRCGQPKCILRTCSCCVLSCLLVLGLLQAALAILAWNLVSIKNNYSHLHDPKWTPREFPRFQNCGWQKPECVSGYKDDALIDHCGRPCFGINYILEWEKFAKNHSYNLVYFPSRPGPNGEGPANISAWYLPADTSFLPSDYVAPRIVIMHGLASNANHCAVQAACYLLRTMGFSCLTPSIRDYGLSGHSTHPDVVTWGYDYHLDALGAWDYAVNDPDGIMGGPLPDNKVGIMGFSKGALLSANAFALEKRIHAAWLDSGPYSGLSGAVDAYIRPYLGRLSWLMTSSVIWWAEHLGGEEVDKYLPTKLLATCDQSLGPRYVLVTQSGIDDVVPFSEGLKLSGLLGGLPECYKLSSFTPPESCDGYHHHAEMNQYPDTVRVDMCKFWSAAFERPEQWCALDKLPHVQLADQSPWLTQMALNDGTLK